MIDTNEIVCKKLQELRLSKGLSQGKFAESIGMGQVRYHYLESGQRKVGLEVLEKLREVYKCPISWFVGETTSQDGDDTYHPFGELALQLKELSKRGHKTQDVALISASNTELGGLIQKHATLILNKAKTKPQSEPAIYVIKRDNTYRCRFIERDLDDSYIIDDKLNEVIKMKKDDFSNIEIVGKLIGQFSWSEN